MEDHLPMLSERFYEYIPEKVRRQIKTLKLKYCCLRKNDLELFPSLTYIHCQYLHHKSFEIDFTGVARLEITTRDHLHEGIGKTFDGEVIYLGKSYRVKNGVWHLSKSQ